MLIVSLVLVLFSCNFPLYIWWIAYSYDSQELLPGQRYIVVWAGGVRVRSAPDVHSPQVAALGIFGVLYRMYSYVSDCRVFQLGALPCGAVFEPAEKMVNFFFVRLWRVMFNFWFFILSLNFLLALLIFIIFVIISSTSYKSNDFSY